MSGSARLAAFGVSLMAAAVGVLAGAAVQGSSAAIDTVTATPVVAPTAQAPGAIDEQLVASDAVISGSVATLVAGSLAGRPVTVVALGEAAGPATGTLLGDVTSAGAVAGPSVLLLEGWIDESLAPLRSGLAAQLTSGEPRESVADLDAVLARSLAGGSGAAAPVLAALAGAGLIGPTLTPDDPVTAVPAVPGAPIVDGSTDPVTDEIDPAITGGDPASGPAGGTPTTGPDAHGDAPALVVFVTAGPVPAGAFTAWTGVIATWLSTLPGVDVVVAEYATPAAADDDSVAGSSLVVGIRQGPLVSRVSTVDNADTGLGRLSVIRWAAGAPRVPVAHYGSMPGAGAAVAPVPGRDSVEPGG